MPHNIPFWKRNVSLLLSLAITAAFLAILIGFDAALPDGKLHISFLDVGQGDAALVRTPQGKNILIDAGPSDAIGETLGSELPFLDRSLDLIILTHPHRDHLAGYTTVLKQYRVGAVLLTGVKNDLPEYQWFMEQVKDKTNFTALDAHDYEIEPGLVFDILYPRQNLSGLEIDSSKLNPTSIVFRLLYGETRVLFTGDIDTFVEDEILRAGVDIRSTVLKIAHHGSKYSSSRHFISQVHPKTAVISVGQKNTFGHPSPQLLQTLKDLNIQTYRTDVFGTVRATCDAKNACEFRYDKFPVSTNEKPEL